MPRNFACLAAFCLALLGVMALSLSAVPASARADDVSSLEKQYDDARSQGSRTKMKRIVGRIADTNTQDAASFLVELLENDQKDRKRPRPGPNRLPGDVRDAIVEALSRFTEEESVGLIGKMAIELKSDREPRLALDQFDYFKALAGMSDIEPADKTLRRALGDPSNPYIKVAALEAIRQQKAGRFVDDVCAILREENTAWAEKWLIVPINTLACLTDIVEPEDTDDVIKVVESVIHWEEHQQCENERVRYFGGRMLNRLTGEVAGMDSVHFWKWWVAQMKTVGSVEQADRPDDGRSKTAARPPVVFDTAPVGRRFVFVIDISLSMEDPLKITLKEIEDRRKKRGPVTGKGRSSESEGDEDDKEDDNPLRQLPWQEISKKIHLAREELARALLSFEGDREFAIVVYSTEVEVITKGWVKATARNCKLWASKARELEPEAMTNIHGALTRALKIHDRGLDCDYPSVNERCVLTGADTILFLTDGWASWDDQSERRVTDKRNNKKEAVGDGPFIYGEDILPDILRVNLFRKVIVNTVGIGNHDKNLMRNLARATGGTYVDWGFPED